MPEIDALLPYVSDAPALLVSVLLWMEFRGLRAELVPVLMRLDERVKRSD
jgi:hypothetical protein